MMEVARSSDDFIELLPDCTMSHH